MTEITKAFIGYLVFAKQVVWMPSINSPRKNLYNKPILTDFTEMPSHDVIVVNIFHYKKEVKHSY